MLVFRCWGKLWEVLGLCRLIPTFIHTDSAVSLFQEIATRETRILTLSVLIVPLVSTMIHMTPAAASHAPVTMGSAVQ